MDSLDDNKSLVEVNGFSINDFFFSRDLDSILWRDGI